jgi:hypothetical protein
MHIFTVSRLRITETLCEDTTPVVVIGQCMASHGYESNLEAMGDKKFRKKCIDKLNALVPLVVKEPRRAVRYINNQTIFTSLEKVERAMEFLVQAEDMERSDINVPAMVRARLYGPITEENPESLDCTILYRLVKKRGLQTRPEYTADDLFRLLTMDVLTSVKRIRDFIVEEIRTMPVTDILNNFYPLLRSTVKDPMLPLEELFAKYLNNVENSLSDPLRLRMPVTDHEAILLAAKNYKIDISGSLFPNMEYAVIITRGHADRSFPVDTDLQDRLQGDTHALDLKQRFNPLLPPHVYGPEDIGKMAAEEGWTVNTPGELGDPYRFLRATYHKNTFFAFGKGPMATVQPLNSDLVIQLEPVSGQDPTNMVLFGNRANVSEMKALSWIELIQTFENYREFRNPLETSNQSIFDDFCINKLIVLARKPCISQIVSNRRKRLVATIEGIRLENEKKMRYLETVRLAIQESKEKNDGLKVLLEALYEMALAMRSFRENEVFSDGISSGSLDNEETQMAVALAAIKLDYLVKDSDPWVADTFLNLPLVIYYPRENKFSTSETNFEGHTLGGRLNIVHMGDTTTAVSSCLRLSSNWFMSSVFYYQQSFGFPVRFDVTRLRHIG